jgi:hypothetical protein
MKSALLKLLFCCLLLSITTTGANAQETVQGLKQKLDITIDDLGNAVIEVTMKLNAAQWDNYKRLNGNNTSILKRELEKSLPKNFLTNFSYSEDAMERTWTMKMKALGLCTLNKNGRWEADIEAKNPDITKLSDREFIMTEDLMTDGMLVQQTQKLHLPEGCSDAKTEKNSLGSTLITYKTGIGWGHRLVNYSGILLMVAGGGLFYRRLRKKGGISNVEQGTRNVE